MRYGSLKTILISTTVIIHNHIELQGFYFDLYNHIPHAFRYYQSVCIEFMTYVGKNSNCMPGQITKKFVNYIF